MVTGDIMQRYFINGNLKEQNEFLLKNQGDIWVGYEELFEGPTMELEIKNGLFDMEKLLDLSITVCKKYGKEIKAIYGGE